MAIKMTMTVSGVTVTDAIHRVKCITLHGKDRMAFLVKSFADSQAPEAFSEVGYECAYDLEGANPMAQAYDHLMTLADFAAASMPV